MQISSCIAPTLTRDYVVTVSPYTLMLQDPTTIAFEDVPPPRPTMPLLVQCSSYDAVQRKVTLLFTNCIFLTTISAPRSNLRSSWVLNCDYILIKN